MSGTHKERSRSGLGGGGGQSGGDDDEAGGDGPTKTDGYDKAEQGGGKTGKKAKRVSLFRFRKANKVQDRRRRRGSFVNSQCWVGGGGDCCLCVKGQMTVGSPGDSPPSDPNSAEFSFEMLRYLIEKNNFYDKECNTHFDEEDVDSHV